MFTKILCSLLFIFVFRNPSQAQTGCFLSMYLLMKEYKSVSYICTIKESHFWFLLCVKWIPLNSWAGVERSIGLEHLICPISSLLCEKLPYYLLHLVTTPGTGPDCSLMCQPPRVWMSPSLFLGSVLGGINIKDSDFTSFPTSKQWALSNLCPTWLCDTVCLCWPLVLSFLKYLFPMFLDAYPSWLAFYLHGSFS